MYCQTPSICSTFVFSPAPPPGPGPAFSQKHLLCALYLVVAWPEGLAQANMESVLGLECDMVTIIATHFLGSFSRRCHNACTPLENITYHQTLSTFSIFVFSTALHHQILRRPFRKSNSSQYSTVLWTGWLRQ